MRHHSWTGPGRTGGRATPATLLLLVERATSRGGDTNSSVRPPSGLLSENQSGWRPMEMEPAAKRWRGGQGRLMARTMAPGTRRHPHRSHSPCQWTTTEGAAWAKCNASGTTRPFATSACTHRPPRLPIRRPRATTVSSVAAAWHGCVCGPCGADGGYAINWRSGLAAAARIKRMARTTAVQAETGSGSGSGRESGTGNGLASPRKGAVAE